MSGSEMARAPSSRTRSAALAMRSTGWAIRRLSKNDEIRVVAIAIRANGSRALRSAAMIWSMSPASQGQHAQHRAHVLDGIDTDTTRSPISSIRVPATGSPSLAWAISAARASRAARATSGLVSESWLGQAEGRLAGLAGRRQGLGLHAVGDDIAVGQLVALGVEQPRPLRARDEQALQDVAGLVGGPGAARGRRPWRPGR
jgi:hypothetical protein